MFRSCCVRSRLISARWVAGTLTNLSATDVSIWPQVLNALRLNLTHRSHSGLPRLEINLEMEQADVRCGDATRGSLSPIHVDGLNSRFVVGQDTRMAMLAGGAEIRYPKMIARTDLIAREINRGA